VQVGGRPIESALVGISPPPLHFQRRDAATGLGMVRAGAPADFLVGLRCGEVDQAPAIGGPVPAQGDRVEVAMAA
jgi:hypothetical protein